MPDKLEALMDAAKYAGRRISAHFPDTALELMTLSLSLRAALALGEVVVTSRAETDGLKSDSLLEFQRTVGEWGEKTFGKGRPGAIFAHLEKEFNELKEAILSGRIEDIKEESADNAILLAQLAHTLNFSLIEEARKKHGINVTRT